ncbi:hypothetical protein OP10G_3028 [Fimbriimonas ginsengisoli Gsoil 348]|uniref:Uncharacterized protein n=1 Tax=Fimbriimonas ginsengisoli Gsoil 348 TaxID=661478 RepID=A0A068NSH6_FIMGI|nr:hypothetical protein OP10G_3028 [Fimbriimonas ginsengisoli Gsoil 348]
MVQLKVIQEILFLGRFAIFPANAFHTLNHPGAFLLIVIAAWPIVKS